MKATLFREDTGALGPIVTAPDAAGLDAAAPEGWSWIAGGHDAATCRLDLVSGEVVERAADIEDRRRAVHQAIMRRRNAAEWGGCASALGRVQTDPDSQRKISGAVQMAMIADAAGATFALDWTMADNSSVTHDAPAMIAMGLAVGGHVAACHARALALKAKAAAAGSVEALDAVDIEAGWPGSDHED